MAASASAADTSCCPGEARAAASAAACERELAEMAVADPTLSSCCARDLKEQRQAARLRGVLAAADRTAAPARERERAIAGFQGVAAVAAAASQQQRQRERGDDSDSEFDDDDDDDDDDADLLARLREARLAEMRRRAAERRCDCAAGFGRLNDAGPAGVVDAARASGAARCVVHLAADGHEAGTQLDERLAELARALMPAPAAASASAGASAPGVIGDAEAWRRRRRRRLERGGVLFLRAPVGAAAAPSAAALALCRDLGLCGGGGAGVPRGALPALVVVVASPLAGAPPASSGGAAAAAVAVEACAPVARFCAEDGALREDRVDAFLRAVGVLSGRRRREGGVGGSGGGGGGDEDEDEEDEEGEEEEDGAPCQLCGRTYPHEHVRAVYGRREEEEHSQDSGGD